MRNATLVERNHTYLGLGVEAVHGSEAVAPRVTRLPLLKRLKCSAALSHERSRGRICIMATASPNGSRRRAGSITLV